MGYSEEIVAFLRQRRLSTTEVADAMSKTGLIPLLSPVNSGHYRAGRLRCVFAANDSNYAVHEQIRHVQAHDVVVVFVHNCDRRAILGGLVSRFILEHRRAEALVVQGYVRDAHEIIANKYAVWCNGFTPIGCFNSPAADFPEAERDELVERYEGAIVVCDDSGVVAIPKDKTDADMLERLERIQIQEEVWSYCMDTLGWNTKKIICDKAYLEEPEALPSRFQAAIERLRVPLDS